jgi:hypothetical protein
MKEKVFIKNKIPEHGGRRLKPLYPQVVFRIFGSDPDRISRKSGLDPTRSESEKIYLAIQ